MHSRASDDTAASPLAGVPQGSPSLGLALSRRRSRAGPSILSSSQPSKLFFKELSGLFHMLLDIRLQMPRSCLPIICCIAHSTGKEDEFVGIRRRQDEVFGVASHHAEPIDQHAKEEVRSAQVLSGRAGDEAGVGEGGKGSERVGRPQAWVSMPVHDLEVLDGVFERDDAAVAVFEIDLSGLDELLDLLPPQVECHGEVPGRPAVNVGVPMGLNPLAE